MNNNKIKSSETIIKVSAIIRMCIIAVLAFMLAYKYADGYENIIRIYKYKDAFRLVTIALSFVVDMIMTVTWIKRPKLHTAHMVLYMLFGGIIYMLYVIDYYNTLDIQPMIIIGVLYNAFLIWFIGLIPFIICGVGRCELTKEKNKQEQIKIN